MEKFIPKKIYKDSKPEDTINRIKGILNENGIHLKEACFHHVASQTDASELRFDYKELGKTRIATNGKGMNEVYSLASAHGEMMERLQCDALLRSYQLRAYLEKKTDILYGKDECLIDGSEYIRNNDFFEKLLNKDKEKLIPLFERKKLLVIPFYDVFNDQQVLVPMEELLILVGSNGMCAGNTPKEAIAQGLNEIYERAALKEIFYENGELHKLDKSLFEGTSVYEKLKFMETLGIRSDIIDCSLGKDYPVIGLRLQNENGLSFNLGADPNPIVALERCLTEQYQLLNDEKLKCRFTRESCGTRTKCRNIFEEDYYRLQFIRSKRVGTGEKPDNVFEIPDIFSDHYVYNHTGINDYEYLKDLTERLGYSLYIRDCSYLGFPAYITLIPEISFADWVDDDALKGLDKRIGNLSCEEKEEYEVILPIVQRLAEKKKASNIHQDVTMFLEGK